MPKDAVMDSSQNLSFNLDKELERLDAEIQSLLHEWDLSSDDVGNDGYGCPSLCRESWDCEETCIDLIKEDPLYDVFKVDQEIRQSFREEATKETLRRDFLPGKARHAGLPNAVSPTNDVNSKKTSPATDHLGLDSISKSKDSGNQNGYVTSKSITKTEESGKVYISTHKGFLNCELKMEFDSDLIKEDPLYDLAEVEREALNSFSGDATGGVIFPIWKSPKKSPSPVEDIMILEVGSDEEPTPDSQDVDVDGEKSPEEPEEKPEERRHFLRERKAVSYRFDEEDEDEELFEEGEDDDLDKNWSANDDDDDDDDEPLIETVRPRRKPRTRNAVMNAEPKDVTE